MIMWLVIIFATAVGLMFLQIAYPFVLWVISLFVRTRRVDSQWDIDSSPSVTIIVPVYSKDIHLLSEKLINTSELDYSPDLLEIIVSGDGELPELPGIVEQAQSVFPLRYNQTGEWIGKNRAMNEAVKLAGGDIIVVSDVDTSLSKNAVALIAWLMKDMRVGGVSGVLKVIKPHKARAGLGQLQKIYWVYEKWIKSTEMTSLGSVTACSGQLFAIRKDIYPDLPSDLNDDLYLLLTVVDQGFRFLGEPEAKAFITPPSKTIADELIRRPRIVSGGLTAIWKRRRIFIRKSTFVYGICLFIHKVLRRLTPVFLVVILATTGMLAFHGSFWMIFFGIQVAVLFNNIAGFSRHPDRPSVFNAILFSGV